MASIEELQQSFLNAHTAGDKQAASALAAQLKLQLGQAQAPPPISAVPAAIPGQGGFIPGVQAGALQVAESAARPLEDIGVQTGIPQYVKQAMPPLQFSSVGAFAEDPWTATKEIVGQQLAPLSATMIGATAGRALGGRFGPAGAKVGEEVGAYLPNLAMQYQEARARQEQEGVDDRLKALLAAGGGAALETLGLERVARKAMLGRGAPAGTRIQNALIGAGVAAPVEAITEAAQSGLTRYAAGQELASPEAVGEYQTGALGGTIGGGVLGGAIGAAQRPAAPVVPPTPITEPTEPETDVDPATILAEATDTVQQAAPQAQEAQQEAPVDPLAVLDAQIVEAKARGDTELADHLLATRGEVGAPGIQEEPPPPEVTLETPPTLEPGPAIWRNKDTDQPVQFIGIEGPDDTGRQYARVKVGNKESFVPADELVQEAKPVPAAGIKVGTATPKKFAEAMQKQPQERIEMPTETVRQDDEITLETPVPKAPEGYITGRATPQGRKAFFNRNDAVAYRREIKGENAYDVIEKDDGIVLAPRPAGEVLASFPTKLAALNFRNRKYPEAEVRRNAEGQWDTFIPPATTVPPVQTPPARELTPAETAPGIEVGEIAAEPATIPPVEPAPEPAQAAAPQAPAPTPILDQWDRDNRNRRSDVLFEGAHVDGGQRLDELPPELAQRQSHGMAKAATAGQALKDLVSIFQNGLDPSRRGGRLDTASLGGRGSRPGATASGNAYRDGPFILVANEGVGAITGPQDIAAVLVNPALESALGEIRAALPNVTVDLYQNAESALRGKPETPSAIQEQAADEGVLRQERSEVGLQKVVGQEPKEAAAPSKAQEEVKWWRQPSGAPVSGLTEEKAALIDQAESNIERMRVDGDPAYQDARNDMDKVSSRPAVEISAKTLSDIVDATTARPKEVTDDIPGTWRNVRATDATVEVQTTEKGYSVAWAPDDVQEFRGPTAKVKVLKALQKEGYAKAGYPIVSQGKPLAKIKVKRQGIESETGRKIKVTERADEALKDVDAQIKAVEEIKQCLG